MSIAPQQSVRQTYWELLKHPNWQRKRLEILDREQFTCQECGAQEATLHVHHTYYEKGLKPWEYPSDSLRVLCERCHRTVQGVMLVLQMEIGKLCMADQLHVLGVALGLKMKANPTSRQGAVGVEFVASGVAAVFGTDETFIIEHANEDSSMSGSELIEALQSERVQ